MPNSKNLVALRDFVLDTAEATAQLDSVGTRDAQEAARLAAELGRQAWKSLVRRRASLDLTPAEAARVQDMLDSLQARLHFLERRTAAPR